MSLELDDEYLDLESAEDFLDYFQIDYDPAMVKVNRLHILQRFHNFLIQAGLNPTDPDNERGTDYRDCLQRAYDSFVGSDAATEKVLKVYRMGEPSVVNIPVSAIEVTRR